MKLLIRDDMTVDSRTIAEGCGVEHRSAFRLLTEHREVIERELGVMRFEIAKPSEGSVGGRPEKFALLTEDQATALITMFRNTAIVVRFKVALAKAFGEAKRQQTKLPTYGDLARMVLDYEKQMGVAGEVFDRIMPTVAYGSLATNGARRVGIRRASFVACASRLRDAATVLELCGQLNLPLQLIDAKEEK